MLTPRAISKSSSHLTVLTPRSENRSKTELSDAIKAYTAVHFNVGQFRLALAGKVNIDTQLERLLRQHEAGDEQSYAAFGKLIFRQLDAQCPEYNRVDKISMNEPAICKAENAYQHLSRTANVPRRKSKMTD